jgi:hypothetical protein
VHDHESHVGFSVVSKGTLSGSPARRARGAVIDLAIDLFSTYRNCLHLFGRSPGAARGRYRPDMRHVSIVAIIAAACGTSSDPELTTLQVTLSAPSVKVGGTVTATAAGFDAAGAPVALSQLTR